MPFTAKFGGTCARCGEWVLVGEQAEYVEDQFGHADCPAWAARNTPRGSNKEFDLTPPGRQEVYCDKCFCHHAGECL